MSQIKIFLFALLLTGSLAHAEEGGGGGGGGMGVGLNLGIGLPFLSQYGVNVRLNNKFGISAGYGVLDIDVDEANLKLDMPEALLNYHPFGGSFYLGLGLGKEKLEVTATESTTSTKISIEVEAMTTLARLGWMWGVSDGGFWFGMDVTYIKPNSPEKTSSAPGVPTSDPNYQDADEAADDFGKSAYANFTFARFGWVF